MSSPIRIRETESEHRILRPVNCRVDDFEPLTIFVGYDEREHNAFDVCRRSILEHNSSVNVLPLSHRDLRSKGLFWRKWAIEPSTGRTYDEIDGKCFSTQFAQTRFLVPQYARFLGLTQQYVMFVDCDFVFFENVVKLFSKASKPLNVVKHEYTPENKTKMDGQIQTQYEKKLWSSLMIFDVEECASALTLDYVNNAQSSDLHRFKWISENKIGELPESWNFIPGHSESRTNEICAIHYTEGTPEMPGYETSRYSQYYRRYSQCFTS